MQCDDQRSNKIHMQTRSSTSNTTNKNTTHDSEKKRDHKTLLTSLSNSFVDGRYNLYFDTNNLFDIPLIAYSTCTSFFSVHKIIPIGSLSPSLFNSFFT